MSTGHSFLGADDLVTGEAVALELPPASVGLRVASGLIDVLVAALLVLGVLLVVSTATIDTDAALSAAVGLVGYVLVIVGLPTAVETASRGRSLGKLALGLRTVRDDAGPISFRYALIRALVGVVEIWILAGVPALLAGLVSTKGKRLGDMAAGTYVVRERFAFPGVLPLHMPPELAGWAGRADIAPLPDGLALAARQFLRRAGSLNPASRAALGDQLLAQAMRHVAPAPPPGHHPEALLTAVLAERRRRDEVRLARDEELRRRLRSGR